jgi:Mg/Co/Ni transporter MgtE
MLLLPELKARLAAKYDPDELLEVLHLLDSEVLVEALSDYIEENYDKLLEEVEDEFSPFQEG